MKRSKARQINFRVTEQDYMRLHRRALTANMPLSGYLLTAALDHKIIVVDGWLEASRELRRIGNNINQLTRLCHEGRVRSPDLSEVKEQLNHLWRSLSSQTQREV